MIRRAWQKLDEYLEPNKVLVIYGPRRVGKTTLVKSFLDTTNLKYKFDSGDDARVQQVLASESIEEIKRYTEGVELVVIDEAQKIPKVGTGLKIMTDHVPGIKIIATGSASFDLANKVGEPLTGRKRTLNLYPVSQMELVNNSSAYEVGNKLVDYLIFGSYPEALTNNEISKKKNVLGEIVNSYLFRDVLEIERVKGAKVMLDLLRLLAHQIGSEVSLRELGANLDLDAKTVGRYLDLLEKSFVIINLRGLSRNLRKEVTRTSKYYFYDNGIRNALIENFNDLNLRNDIGQLWENFMFIERMKYRSIKELGANCYFWRTWDQKEIDLVEERGGKYFAYEFKFKQNVRIRAPADFAEGYKDSEFEVISRDNYLGFVAG